MKTPTLISIPKRQPPIKMVPVEMDAEAVDLIESIAAREGVTIQELLTAVFHILPSVDVKQLRRLHEIEQAASLQPGGLFNDLLSGAEFAMDDGDELFDWIQNGWELTSDLKVMKRNLWLLTEKWRAEDAAESVAA